MPTSAAPIRSARLRMLLLGLTCLNASCGSPYLPPFHSLVAEQPMVLEVDPADGSRLPIAAEFTIRFSERIDVRGLSSQSVALLSGVKDPRILDNASDLMDKLVAGELPQVSLQYLLDSDERSLTLLPEASLNPGIYYLVITPALRSVTGVPFNQNPGENPTSFLARFVYGDVPAADGAGGDPDPAGGFGEKPQTLVINEFLYDGKVSDTDGESFVELSGTPGGDISLYQVLFVNGADGATIDRVTLPPGSILPPDGLFVIADLRTGSHTESRVPNADFFDQFDPQNGPDGIQLLDRDGKLVDSAAYGSGAAPTADNGLALGEGDPAPDVAAGHSLSRREGRDTENNQADFIDLATPTPGEL